MRRQLAEKGLVSFIANGSLLPRQSGASALPMKASEVESFLSPKAISYTLTKKDTTPITGLGFPMYVSI